jgi:peptide/nickel transport system permease protein
MAVVVAVPWIARWLARRIVLGVLVLWGAATLAFISLHMLPGNTAELIAGGLREPTPQQVAYVTREYGFNLPLADQYGRFLWSLMRGNLGMSYQLNEPVATVIGSQLWASAQLALGGMAIALAFALAVALSTAGRPRARAVSNSAELLFLSIPQFWVGILLLTAFSFRLHWFPVIGNAGIRSLILPWITVALPVAAYFTIVMREGLDRALEQPFALTVRARGATERRLRLRHALRHALLPVLTISGVTLGQLLGGIVVIEEVFTRQGIGQVTVTAVQNRDFPLVIGIVVLATLTFVVINSVVDLLYRVVDPRLRTELS